MVSLPFISGLSCPKISLHIKNVNMDTKQQIIKEYLSGGQGYRVLEKEHGISRCTIHRWVVLHQAVQQRLSLLKIKNKPGEAELAATITALNSQAERDRLQIKLLTAMIDIAEQDLKIPIRKKYGTRRSKK